VTSFNYPAYPTRHGYMSEQIQRSYIQTAVAQNVLPADAHRMAQIISLTASNDITKPIQFWQLFSVLGPEPMISIVTDFYTRVFRDEDWFASAFARIGGVEHHIRTQSSMWIDVMGGGPAYHGGDFRLNFHHTHNAFQVMTDKGAALWTKLMLESLEASKAHMTDDPRVRPAINTFLSYFMGKYAQEFAFENKSVFGDTNPAVKRKINFLKMTTEAIEALTEDELRAALEDNGVDASQYPGKQELVNKALML
jgi:truncated hemoglobin YjbI